MAVPPGPPRHLPPELLLKHIEDSLHGCFPANRPALLTRREMLLRQLDRPITPWQPPSTSRPDDEEQWRAEHQRYLHDEREREGRSRAARDSPKGVSGFQDSRRRR